MARTQNADLPPWSIDPILVSLHPREIALALDLRDKEQALAFAAALIASSLGINAEPVTRALLRREEAGSTALGQGVAIPHARISGVKHPMTIFLRSKVPIPFDAPDGKPVSDLLVLVVPVDGATDEHLQRLAMLAAMFSDRVFRARLRGAVGPSDVSNAFAQWLGKHAPSAARATSVSA
jgi:nitrogen PTS system EIIA component